jgi:prophage regulatory protein
MKVLRWPNVHELVGLSRPTIWRLETKNEFPHRRRLTATSVGWIEAEVLDWLQSREVGFGPRPGEYDEQAQPAPA